MAIPSFSLGNGNWASKENAILGFKQNSDGVFGAIEGDVTRASTKTRVNANGLIEEVPIGVASIDYLDDVNGALKCEPQSTNLFTYSEDFSTSWSASRASVSVNQILSPDGTQNADKIIQSTGQTFSGGVFLALTTSISNYTLSVFAKKSEKDYLILGTASNGNLFTWFNLNTGQIETISSGYNAKMENYGNGWYRCSISFSESVGGGRNMFIYSADTDNSQVVTDSGGIYIFGAQLEQLSYPTSYIPTSGATVTRLADAIDGFGTAQTFNSSEGVLFVDAKAFIGAGGGTRRVALFDVSGTKNVRIQFSNGAGDIFAVLQDGATVTLSDLVTDITQYNKIAFKWKLNDFALWVNGIEVDTSLSGATLASNTLEELKLNQASNEFLGEIRQIKVYNTALTDTELQTLTT